MNKYLFNRILAVASLVLITYTLVISCRPKENGLQANTSLEGSWRFLYSTSTYPDTSLAFDSTTINSIYLIGKDHFSFISIHPETDSLMFAGCGRYTIENGKYVEKVEFHSSEFFNQTAIIFDSKLEGDTWTHEGYIPIDQEEDSLSLTLSNGQDQYKLTEVRKRIPSVGSSSNEDLKNLKEKYMGAWDLVSVDAVFPDTSFSMLAGDTKSIYHIGPDKFSFMYFTGGSNELDIAGYGSYEILSDTSFLERVEYHSILNTLKGNQVRFSSKIEGDTWTKSSILPISEEGPLADYGKQQGKSAFRLVEIRKKISGM